MELTIVSNTYLSASEKKKLYDAHDGIITLIPEITDQEIMNSLHQKRIDLSKDINSLFEQYFKFKNKGQEPSEGIKSLFREVLGHKGEKE